MQPTQRRFSMVYFIMALVVFFAVQAALERRHNVNLAYSDFKLLLEKRRVRDVVLDRDMIGGVLLADSLAGVLPAATVEALTRTGGQHRFTTARVEDPDLARDLKASGVRFAGRVKSVWTSALISWLLPILLFFGLWGVLMRRMAGQQGLMTVGKSKAKVYVERSTGVTFQDVAGIDEARDELVEIVDYLKNPDRYRRLGGRIPKGVLLVGPPGTGKTLLAKAVAGEARVPFFSLTGSEFVEMFVGVGAARVRDLFAQAYAAAPAIIFIDEMDALGKARGTSIIAGSHDEREQTLNQLLAEMDGFDTQKGVILLAATNRPEVLDPALLRPGRFDRKVVVDRPDLKGRQRILEVHVRDVTLSPAVDLAVIAAKTPGFVGADLANLVNEAALSAARAGKAAVEMDDFEISIDRVIAGLERKSRVITPREKRIVAYHEAGHALIAESREFADPVAKVSIIPRGVAALGYTQQLPTEDRYLLTRRELLDRLDVLLGGRVAEEIVFGDISTGAQDDLQRATDLVRHMITRYGMSEAVGLATSSEPVRPAFLELPGAAVREHSEATARLIDHEIKRLLEEAHERVSVTLSQCRQQLEALARLLLEAEVVNRETLTGIVGATRVQRPAALVAKELAVR